MLNGAVKAAMFYRDAFDPVQMFGSEKMAQAILEGREQGESPISTNRFGNAQQHES